jgi:hypothetical protein
MKRQPDVYSGHPEVSGGQLDEKLAWKASTVRRFIGWIAPAFPLVLLCGYLELEDTAQPDSISAYYSAPATHTVFIVLLLVLGVSLIFSTGPESPYSRGPTGPPGFHPQASWQGDFTGTLLSSADGQPLV